MIFEIDEKPIGLFEAMGLDDGDIQDQLDSLSIYKVRKIDNSIEQDHDNVMQAMNNQLSKITIIK